MRPGRLILIALLSWAAVGGLAAFVPAALATWWGTGALIGGAIAWDAWSLRHPPSLRVTRTLPAALSLREWHDLSLRLENFGRRSLSLRAFEHHPADAEVEGMPRRAQLRQGRFVELPWRLKPTERGEAQFGQTAVETEGPLHMLARHDLLGTPIALRVYPSFRRVARHALLALGPRAGQQGVHLQRRRGLGLEFHQLREYRQGDSPRQIDWRSVSRRRQLISREYREERNQRVVFLLDCGRRMHTRDSDVRLFDRALDAALLLSYIALRQGDGVGLIAFSGQNRWLPPVRGSRGMRAILNAVYDLHTTTAPSDYAEAARQLATRQRRRALVVVLTNLRDDDSDALIETLAPLRRRHLVLVASLRDPALDDARDAAVETFDDALSAASLQAYFALRDEALRGLRGRGLQVLDVQPAELPTALVRRYLEIKRAGKL